MRSIVVTAHPDRTAGSSANARVKVRFQLTSLSVFSKKSPASLAKVGTLILCLRTCNLPTPHFILAFKIYYVRMYSSDQDDICSKPKWQPKANQCTMESGRCVKVDPIVRMIIRTTDYIKKVISYRNIHK